MSVSSWTFQDAPSYTYAHAYWMIQINSSINSVDRRISVKLCEKDKIKKKPFHFIIIQQSFHWNTLSGTWDLTCALIYAHIYAHTPKEQYAQMDAWINTCILIHPPTHTHTHYSSTHTN